MQHFLLTRFNIQVDRWQTTRDGYAVNSQDWLNNRFELFENYCLPSIKNQSNQDFIWCVAFDDQTSSAYKARIEKWCENYSNLQALYVSRKKWYVRQFIAYIQASLRPETQFVITTRLDNDDLVHSNFVKEIQVHFENQHGMLIDLERGYQLVQLPGLKEIRNFNRACYHFISLVEHLDHIKTIYQKPHNDWHDYNKVKSNNKDRLWVELIHSHNMANKIRRASYLTKDFNPADFGLSTDFKLDQSSFSIWWTNIWIFFKNQVNKYYNLVLKK